MSIVTRSVGETHAFGEDLAVRVLRAGDLLVLVGDLGSGKTALAQGIARGLGVVEQVTSPSFVIVREYPGRIPLVHADVYRLGSCQELYDLGFEEIFDPGSVTLMEWGNLVDPVLPGERLEIRIRAMGNGSSMEDDAERLVELVPGGEGWRSRATALTDVETRWRERQAAAS